MSTAHPVPPEIEAALPDDAPLGHIAHEKVKVKVKSSIRVDAEPAKLQLVMMNVKVPGNSSVAFQVTMLPMGENGSEYALERIARACWVFLESGASKEEATQFRTDCYKKIASVKTQSKPRAEQKLINGDLTQKSEASPQNALGSTVDSESAGTVDTVTGPLTLAKTTSASVEVTDSARSPLEDIGDAPEGHDAWSKVKPIVRADGRADFRFHFLNGSGGKTAFQTTVTAAGGGEEMAERVARLCYVRFSEGCDKNGVLAYRDELYSKLRGGQSSKDLIPQSKSSPQNGLGSAVDSKNALTVPLQDISDAPEGHDAWGKVKSGSRGGTAPYFQFYFRNASGDKIAFQTTVTAAGGSEEIAERVARLCYVRFSEGCEKNEVIAYRDQLYSKLCGGCPSKKRDVPASMQTSQKRARVAGAQKVKQVLVEGRAAGSKNESINGVYALLSSLSDGRAAYRKNNAEDAPRFLIYSAEKERWRICPSLDSDKVSFAFLKVSDGGASLPFNTAGGPSWQVFSGKDEGYAIDPDVRSLHFKGKRQRQESYSYSSSDSETSHDESAPRPKVTPAKAVPAKPAPTKVAPVERRRVFAKMLVCSGLRCHCHFRYLKNCPDYMASRPLLG